MVTRFSKVCRIVFLFVVVLSLLTARSASAAHVSFTERAIFSSQEILGGPSHLIHAEDFIGGFGSNEPRDIDIAQGTVTFMPGNIPGAGQGGFGGLDRSRLPGDAGNDIRELLSGSNFGDGPFSLTIPGLTPGNLYRMQILGYAVNGSNINDVTVDGETHEDWDTDTGGPRPITNEARVLAARWIQDAGETDVTIDFSDSGGVAGLILHVPEPATAGLILAGLVICGFGLARRRS